MLQVLKVIKNYKELIKVERRTKNWIAENNNLITIVGHTHRPRFPKPGDILCSLFPDFDDLPRLKVRWFKTIPPQF